MVSHAQIVQNAHPYSLQMVKFIQLQQIFDYFVFVLCSLIKWWKIFQLIFFIGGKALAEYTNIPIWGTLPIDQRVSTLARNFRSAIHEIPESQFAIVFKDIIENKLAKT